MTKSPYGPDHNSTVENNEHYSQLIATFSAARDLEDLKQRIYRAISSLGISDYIFLRLKRYWHGESNFGLMHSMPEELVRVYCDEKMYHVDLMIPYAQSNSQPIFASQLYGYLENAPFEIELTQRNRAITQLYKRYGYYDQLLLPMPASNGSGNVLLSVLIGNLGAAEFQSAVNPIIPELRCMCKAIDTITTTQFGTTFIGKDDNADALSPKQLSVLTLLANNDLSISELAKQLNISPITAHQHVAAARQALGVSTNIAAIKKLVSLGIIEFR